MEEHERLVEFAGLVDQMRMAQKRYFRTKGGFSECINLERKVDATVSDILNPRKPRPDQPTQPTLF